MTEDEAVDVEELREDFELPDSVLLHILRTEGSLENARTRLERQEENEQAEERHDTMIVVTACALAEAAVATFIIHPLLRMKTIQQLHGGTLTETWKSATEPSLLSLWRGVQYPLITSLMQLTIKNTLFNWTTEIFFPEHGWRSVSQQDMTVIATLSFLCSTSLLEIITCPFRVCTVRSAGSVGSGTWLGPVVDPIVEHGIWGYFKGLGSLLANRLVNHYVADKTLSPSGFICLPVLLVTDTLFAVMASGVPHLTIFHYLFDYCLKFGIRSAVSLPFRAVKPFALWKIAAHIHIGVNFSSNYRRDLNNVLDDTEYLDEDNDDEEYGEDRDLGLVFIESD